MPHYYFDIHDGIHVIDEVGHELPDLDAAHDHGMKIVSGYAAKPGMICGDGGVIVVVIRNAPNSFLMKMRLVFSVEDFASTAQCV